mgnify:FL=1
MGRVSKRGATTSWDANHAALYQRGFRDLQWDPLETKGPAIKAIIEEAISADSAFETLRWLFSKASGGEKDSNSGLYYHYKEEASEYITQLARIGIRSMCCLSSLSCPCFLLLSSLTLSSSLLPLTTGKFLENSSVQGRRASAGVYRDGSDDSDGEDLDDSSQDDGEDLDSNDDDSNNNTASSRIMVTKTKGSTPQRKLAPASASKGKTNKIDDPAMQELIKRFNVAKIRGDGHVGFDFGAIFPYMWFRFTHNNCNYIQMEIALSSTHPDDLTNTISDDGKHVILKNVVPNTLIDPRIWQLRHQIDDNDLEEHVFYQAGIAAQQYVREETNDDGAKPVQVIPLPFTCQTTFSDPFFPPGPDNGMALSYFPHPSYRAPTPPTDPLDPNQLQDYIRRLEENPIRRVCLLSLTLKSAVSPKVQRGMAQATVYNW